MTADELITHIADALNLSSAEALARIGRNLNVTYKRVTSAIGMVTTRREEVFKAVTIGSQLVTFTGVEKLDVVFRKVGLRRIILTELTNDEMLLATPGAEPPRHYSVFSVTPQSITIKIDCIPTTAFTLYALALGDLPTLTGANSPAFPESFHDILIYGVMTDEYRKMEKAAYAKEAEDNYNQRLSDLKMFIAKSAYLDIYAGKHGQSDGWWDTSVRR